MVRWLRPVMALGAIAVLWLPVVARATASEEQQFTDLVTRERAANSLPAYAPAADLVEVARGQANRMASEGRLYHNPNLTTEVSDWDGVGENVGRGPSVETIHDAFMNSPEHRDEILSARFTQVGVGVAIAADGEIWVAEVFRKPSVAPAATAPAPAPAPRPATLPRAQRARVTSTRPAAAPVAPAVPASAAPVAVSSPPVTEAPSPDLSALVGAFDLGPRVPPTRPVHTTREPDVSMPVRVAATLLVLVVLAQTRFVLLEGMADVPAIRRRRLRIVANATTTP